ncbi:MAG: STAS domain-containing protein [Spirochaetales bacterium]|nr:STAS domain-containing protein [Spirochaetales bacterium]
MPDDVHIKLVTKENEITFIIGGAIDIYNEKKIKTKILDSLTDNVKSVVLDMSEAKTIDSSGICMLIILKNQLKKSGRNFALKSIRDTIGKIFQDTLFEKLFKVID